MAGADTSTSMENTQLPQFNGKNYDYWEITMRALLTSQDLWELVEDGFEEPEDGQAFNALTQTQKYFLKSNRKRDSKTLFYLYQVVHESIFSRIAATKNSKEALDTL